MVRRFNPKTVHSPLSQLSKPKVTNTVKSTTSATVRRFDPDSLQRSGSKPSPKQMYHFASENNAQFLMKCVSDTGNCRTLVSADIAEKWNIPLHSALVSDTLNTVTGKEIKVIGQIMMEATFNNKRSTQHKSAEKVKPDKEDVTTPEDKTSESTPFLCTTLYNSTVLFYIWAC